MKNIMPADVPQHAYDHFKKNMSAITKNTDHLFLFAGDQKIEHLNADFYGNNIAPEAQHPEHLFNIASKGSIGAFATHVGLIARYGNHYKNVHYIAKLNGKTNLIPTEQRDPMSQQLWSVHDVLTFKEQSGLSICGVGYTIYLGSEYEPVMLTQAAQMIYQAHQVGLVAIVWIYPRGKSVHNNNDTLIIAGAAGVAHALGADFVKVQLPHDIQDTQLKPIVSAAGNTGVLCAGGQVQNTHDVCKRIELYMHNHCAGVAIGRNIFQHSTERAITITHAIAAMIYKNKSAQEASTLL